jgi:hypothetical protein
MFHCQTYFAVSVNGVSLELDGNLLTEEEFQGELSVCSKAVHIHIHLGEREGYPNLLRHLFRILDCDLYRLEITIDLETRWPLGGMSFSGSTLVDIFDRIKDKPNLQTLAMSGEEIRGYAYGIFDYIPSHITHLKFDRYEPFVSTITGTVELTNVNKIGPLSCETLVLNHHQSNKIIPFLFKLTSMETVRHLIIKSNNGLVRVNYNGGEYWDLSSMTLTSLSLLFHGRSTIVQLPKSIPKIHVSSLDTRFDRESEIEHLTVSIVELEGDDVERFPNLKSLSSHIFNFGNTKQLIDMV